MSPKRQANGRPNSPLRFRLNPTLLLGWVLGTGLAPVMAQGDEPQPSTPDARSSSLPLAFLDDFDGSTPLSEHWEPKDPAHWKLTRSGDRTVMSHFVKKGKYRPPHRSPVNIAIRKGDAVSDFTMTATVLSTHKDYGHRDACLVFGYQDPAHFYYVHFGKKTDDHANQIFIVDGAARTKISTITTDGTPWDDQWHKLRVTRDVTTGKIAVFFDDMEKPVMTAVNKKFLWGRVGMGSFDDTTDWDQIELRGTPHSGTKAN